MVSVIFLFFLGLAGLWSGAELLVRYSSRFARAIGVSAIIVGLSVVSFGTSAPEFVVSLMAIIQGNAGVSLGNIVGSNIANIGLILGIGAIITPLNVKLSWVKREVPIMIFVTLVFTAVAYWGDIISFIDGLLLVTLLILFLLYLGKYSLKEMAEFNELQKELEKDGNPQRTTTTQKLSYIALAILGIVILVIGSKLTINSGIKIARLFGISDLVIGLTLIAFGTSLPELATTIVGAIRKETDIVVGNVIGSNIFNLLFIGGVVPIIHPLPVATSLFKIHFPILILLSFLILPMMRIKLNLKRIEGFILLIIYFTFLYLTLYNVGS